MLIVDAEHDISLWEAMALAPDSSLDRPAIPQSGPHPLRLQLVSTDSTAVQRKESEIRYIETPEGEINQVHAYQFAAGAVFGSPRLGDSTFVCFLR